MGRVPDRMRQHLLRTQQVACQVCRGRERKSKVRPSGNPRSSRCEGDNVLFLIPRKFRKRLSDRKAIGQRPHCVASRREPRITRMPRIKGKRRPLSPSHPRYPRHQRFGFPSLDIYEPTWLPGCRQSGLITRNVARHFGGSGKSADRWAQLTRLSNAQAGYARSARQEMKKGTAVACRPFRSLRRHVLDGSADKRGVVSEVRRQAPRSLLTTWRRAHPPASPGRERCQRRQAWWRPARPEREP